MENEQLPEYPSKEMSKLVERVCRRTLHPHQSHILDDAVQATHENMVRYGLRHRLDTIANPRAYIAMIARNAARHLGRTELRRCEVSASNNDDRGALTVVHSDEGSSARHMRGQIDVMRTIERFQARLTDEQLWILREIRQGRLKKQIAEELEISAPQLSRKINEMKVIIKQLLDGEGDG